MSVFKVKDLMIRVLGSGGGSAGLCSEDVSVTAPTPITPVILVAAQRPLFEHLQAVTRKAVKKADPATDEAVIDAIDNLAIEVGRGVVVAALGGGGVYLPDPNCDGSSMDTIPTPLTPVVHKNAVTVRATDLPRLKDQLRQALAAADEAEQALTPSGAHKRSLKTKLQGAIEALG